MMLAPLSMLGICRYIVRLNGIEVFPDNLNWEGYIGMRFAHRRTAISDHTRQQVLTQYPHLSVNVCDLSLDHERSTLPLQTEVQQTTGISFNSVDGNLRTLGHHVILHVGRMAKAEQYKGQDVLIRAMPAILDEMPHAQLVLVGRGDDAERLRDLAQAQSDSVQKAIFMTGFVTDEQLEVLYQTCYVFAMPSRGEGFGLVYLEAMRWAKPCLGSRTDSARCIIRHGETGLLADDPANPHQVAQLLLTLLRDQKSANRMGQNGYQLVSEYYLFQHFQQRLIDFIER